MQISNLTAKVPTGIYLAYFEAQSMVETKCDFVMAVQG